MASITNLWGSDPTQATFSSHGDKKTNEEVGSMVYDIQDNADIASNTVLAKDANAIPPTDTQALPTTADEKVTMDTVPRDTIPAPRSLSLYPCAILGLAMVSRGEIGFLISLLLQGNGIFSTDGDDQVFLIVTWAIVLCTMIGPIGVGLLVRQVRKLEKAEEEHGSGRDVLGVWGVH